MYIHHSRKNLFQAPRNVNAAAFTCTLQIKTKYKIIDIVSCQDNVSRKNNSSFLFIDINNKNRKKYFINDDNSNSVDNGR